MAVSRNPEELEILATIQRFSNAINNNEPDVLRSLVHASGSCTRTGINPSSHVHISQSDLVGYISEAAKDGDIEGTFVPDEATVKVDGDLAMVWTTWRSFKAGNMTHKGSIVFVLAKAKEGGENGGKWVIVSNADNLVAV